MNQREAQEFIIKPCDIFLTQGKSFIGRSIRFFETSRGETKSVVNHCGLSVEEGPIISTNIVEALTSVKKHTLYYQYHNHRDRVAIFRPTDLTDEEKTLINNKALSYVGRSYGYLKIAAHLLDYCTGDHYWFRRITNSDNYPICSWVVAYSYSKVNRNFGCDPGMAQPDDIWDYCISHPEKYEYVFKLEKI